MKRTLLIGTIIVTFLLLLTACGGKDEPTPTPEPVGDAVHGEQLYKQLAIGSANAPGCTTCHSLEPDVVVVGPSHAKIGADAGSRVSGLSAEEYLRQSIVTPDAVVTEGYAAGVMYQNFGQDLTTEEIDDLVAFLLTRK